MIQAHKSDCPACGKSLKVRLEQVGRMVRCPSCQQPFELQTIRTSATTSLAGMTVEQMPPGSDATSRSLLGSLEKLGRYEIRSVLGEGGFGRVYRAYDPQLDREVALKVPLFGNQDKVRTQRFLTEAKAAGKLQHPCIVPTFDSGQIDGRFYIATAFIEGKPLSDLIRRGKIGMRQAAEWVRDLAEALAYAHQRDIVHRDIKPHNVMIDGQRQPHLLDFGLAKRTNDDSSVTTDGSLLGTPAYMSPEQARSEHKTIGAASDQYSLGVVLYELLTGKKPFDGSPHVVIGLVAGQSPPKPRSIRRQIPEDIEAICLKAMSRDPAQRYADCAAFAKDLTRWLEGRSTLARPLSLTEQASRWVRRHAAVTALTAAIVVLLAAFVVNFIVRRSNPEQVPREVTQQPPAPPGDPTPPSTDTKTSVTKTSKPTTWHGWPVDAPEPAKAPFDAAKAKKHQEEWAKYLKVPVEYENSIGMRFRLIPPGDFLMGSTAEEIEAALKDVDKYWHGVIMSESPQHKVTLTQPIYVGVNEVTQAEYEKVMGTNPSHFAPRGTGKAAVAELETADHPVETVSWNDAAEFCAKLSGQEKLKPFYFRAGETITQYDGTGYRLPSEAEWEFACRAGTSTKYWTGDKDEDLMRAGWFGGNSGDRTHAAGELKANPFGLSDIHGNVWEWVQDGWDAKYYGQFQGKPAINPNSPFSAGSQRVYRGGFYLFPASSCRSSTRYAAGPTNRNGTLGFRVSLMVDAVKQALKDKPPTSTIETGWHGWPADSPKPAVAPFDADQAKKHQEEWAKYLKVPVEYENSIGMKFRLIPPGEFLMGSTEAGIAAALKLTDSNDVPWQRHIRSEGPQHKVVLSKPFYLGIAEVTQQQYLKVMNENLAYFAPAGGGKNVVQGLDTLQHPVESVSWNRCGEFCQKLSELEKRKPFDLNLAATSNSMKGAGYRLPTEAEWEYSCRAGTTSAYWIGNEQDLVRTAWFDGNAGGRTHATEELEANPFGLFDIHGNVREWVLDVWTEAYSSTRSDKLAVNPVEIGNVRSLRVIRGGYWHGPATRCRASLRANAEPSTGSDSIGFRVALPIEEVNVTGGQSPPHTAAKSTAWHGWPVDAPKPAIAPFDAVEAQIHQEDWAKYLKVPVEYSNSVGIKFRFIPPGEFLMGSPAGDTDAEKDERPQHKVQLTRPFYLGQTEITQAQWKAVMRSEPWKQDSNKRLLGSDFPAVFISWNGAMSFCKSLSTKEGKQYQLPTEAEWEYACRGGTQTTWYFGDDKSGLSNYAWYDANTFHKPKEDYPHGVAKKHPNPFVLFDMHGNVWEWCLDPVDSGAYAKRGEATQNPLADSNSTQRMLRGGSWMTSPKYTRAANRYGASLEDSLELDLRRLEDETEEQEKRDTGFRVVLMLDAVKLKVPSNP